MSAAWTSVSLGELIRLERRPVDVIADHQYQEIGTYSYGRGIFHKTPRSGLEVGDKDLFLMKEGDVILQITFAWEGAIALCSKAEDGLFGSVRYPTFRVNEERCYAPFLVKYLTTREGLEQIGRICPGSAGRNRVLAIKRLPEVKIPLPPRGEQCRIVARVEELAAKVTETRRLREQTLKEIGSIRASVANELFSGASMKGVSIVELEHVAEIRAGVTLGRKLAGNTIRLPYLRVANVQDGRLDLRVIKEVEIYPDEHDKWLLRCGDLLLTEGGDWDKLGRGTVWQGEINPCIHQNHIFRVRIDQTRFDPWYVSALMSSPRGKEFFQAASKQTTNLASINQRQLKSFPLFDLPLDRQRAIVAELDEMQSKVDSVKALQTETAIELDAMLPAILDKAFKREL